MWNKAWAISLLVATSLYGQTPSETRKAEIERLKNLAQHEKDADQQRKLWTEAWELQQQLYREAIPRLRDEWRKETDSEKKRKTGEELVDDAIQTDQAQFVLEVATGGELDQKEIKIPGGNARPVVLHIVRSFDPD